MSENIDIRNVNVQYWSLTGSFNPSSKDLVLSHFSLMVYSTHRYLDLDMKISEFINDEIAAQDPTLDTATRYDLMGTMIISMRTKMTTLVRDIVRVNANIDFWLTQMSQNPSDFTDNSALRFIRYE